MLSGTRLKPGVSPRIPFSFTSVNRPYRNRVVEVTAAAKGRGAPKRGAGNGEPKQSKALFGGLFSSAKKAAANPKQAVKTAKRAVAPPKRAAAAAGGTRKIGGGTKQIGTKRVGGTSRIGTKRVGGTAKIGTKRVGGTSKIGTKRIGAQRAAPPPKRIQLDDETSTTLGAAGVFSLGLATAAFLLFSVFTGIEGPAEAEQVAQSATKSVQNAIQGATNEIVSIAESSAAGDENTKVADLAQKAQAAAEKVPSSARSAASPQVADQSPTGKAGAGFGEQSPSKAEDSQVPNVIKESKEKVEGSGFSGLFGFLSPKVNETSSVADGSIEQQAKEVAGEAAEAAGKPVQAVDSALGKIPAPDVLGKEAVEKPGEAVSGADGNRAATPTGMKGSVTNLADTGIKPGNAFQQFADKLSGSSEQQYADRQVADKKIQKAEDLDANAAFKKSAPGSAGGNSTIGRDDKQITDDPTAQPQPKPTSFLDGLKGVVPGNAASKANEVSSTSEVSPGEDENTKIAALADKAKSAAENVPSDARSAASPQVADAAPTGKAGAGLGEQSPSKAEDSQIPNVIQESKEKVEGSGFSGLFGFLSPKVNETSSVADGSIEQQAKEAAGEAAEAAEKPVQAVDSALGKIPAPDVLGKEAVEKPGEAVSGADGNRAATPTGMKGSVTNLADTGIKPGNAFENFANKLSGSSEEQYADRQVADKKIQKAEDLDANAAFKKSAPGSAGGNSTIGRDEKQITEDAAAQPQPKPLSFLNGFRGFGSGKANEVGSTSEVADVAKDAAEKGVEGAEKAADKAVEAAEKPAEAVEAAVEKVPAPDVLPKESVEKPGEAVKGADGNRAATPTGMEGLVTNLADTGLQRSDAFEEAAKKLRSSSSEQFRKSQEADKEIQAQDDMKRAAAFKQGFPGSSEGNSVIGRNEKQITNDPTATPQAKPFSFDQGGAGVVSGNAGSKAPAQAGNAGNNNLLLIGGAVVVAGIFGVASQQPGGIEGAAEEVSKAADSASKEADKVAEGVKKEAGAAGGATENGAGSGGDVKADIAERKKDAQKWISDWKSSTGGK